jgi:DNA-directed RNA polymerase subunit RPC12/RpoP
VHTSSYRVEGEFPVAAQCGVSAASRAVQEPALYRPRRPAESVLYRVVQEHLETYLALAREGELDADAVPRFVEREFRRYLECGILAHGFARARCSECGHDFLIAFSCKGRGVCPSCNTRRMVQTAAHLVEQVFPRQPVRQWVLSVPKRLRYFLSHDPAVVSSVLHLFLRVVEETLRQSSPGAGSGARFGAVSFLHRFGSALNPPVHFHCCVIDGVFQPDVEGRLRVYPALGLTQERIAKAQEQVRCRVLRAFVRRGLLEAGAARDMRGWDAGGGFSVDASIRVQAHDRMGLERLLRYCARPLLLWSD